MKLKQPLSKKQWKEFFSHKYYRLELEEIDSKLYVRKPGNILEYKYRLNKTSREYGICGVYFTKLRYIFFWLHILWHYKPKTRLYWVDIPEKEYVVDLVSQLRTKRVIEGDYIDLRELHLSSLEAFPEELQNSDFLGWTIITKYEAMTSQIIKSRDKRMKWIEIPLLYFLNLSDSATIVKKLDEKKIKITAQHLSSREAPKYQYYLTDTKNILTRRVFDRKALLVFHIRDIPEGPFKDKIMIPEVIATIIELIKINNGLFYPFLRLYLPHNKYTIDLKDKDYEDYRYKLKKDSLYKALIEYGKEFMSKDLFIYCIVSCIIPENKEIFLTPKDVKFLLSELSMTLCIKTVRFLTNKTNFFMEKITPKEFENFIMSYLYVSFKDYEYILDHGKYITETPVDNIKVIKLLLNKTSHFERLYTRKLLIEISKYLIKQNEVTTFEYFISLFKSKKYRWNYIEWTTENFKRLDEKMRIRRVYVALGKLFDF